MSYVSHDARCVFCSDSSSRVCFCYQSITLSSPTSRVPLLVVDTWNLFLVPVCRFCFNRNFLFVVKKIFFCLNKRNMTSLNDCVFFFSNELTVKNYVYFGLFSSTDCANRSISSLDYAEHMDQSTVKLIYCKFVIL